MTHHKSVVCRILNRKKLEMIQFTSSAKQPTQPHAEAVKMIFDRRCVHIAPIICAVSVLAFNSNKSSIK